MLEFGVLGPLQLWGVGTDSALTAPRLRDLLTLLLLEGGPVPATRVRSALDPEDRWRGSAGPLHVSIHRLRRWLERHRHRRLELGPSGYQIDLPAGSVDADRFRRLLAGSREGVDPPERVEHLIHALSLWRGPVAADAASSIQQQYAARELGRLRRQATVDLALTCLSTGAADRSLPLVERAAEQGPYDEQIQSLYALVLAASGLKAEALHVIERTRLALAAELGIGPSQHLRQAQLTILRT